MYNSILALDTSQELISAALGARGEKWYLEIDAGQRHSELLMEAVDSLCKLSAFDKSSLELVCCMEGPGSFTGLRISYACAKGIALSLGIPLAAVPSLDCMAAHLSSWPGIVIAAMDAKQNRFFSSLYINGSRKGEILDADCDTIIQEIESAKAAYLPPENIILTGAGAKLLYSQLNDSIKNLYVDPLYRRGRAGELLELVKNDTVSKIKDPGSGPLYIRKSDAEINRESGQVLK